MNRFVTQSLMWFLALGVAAVIFSPCSAFAAPIDTLHPGEWYEFPNSKMSTVDPCPSRTCAYSPVSGQTAVMDAWSGGAYDTKRDQLIVWGGGHGDYGGNEVYAFGPLTSSTPAWKRLTEPSPVAVGRVDYYPDGSPSSRHTYNSIDYDPINDRLMSLDLPGRYVDGFGSGAVDSLDLSSLPTSAQVGGWRSDWPRYPGTNVIGTACAYDSVSKVFWFKQDAEFGLAYFDPAADSGKGKWTNTGCPTFYIYDYTIFAIDTKRHQLVSIGDENGLYTHDLNHPSSAATHPVSSGDAGGIALEHVQAPGFVYDPVGDRFLAWNGGTAVYALDPVTFIWSKLTNLAGNTVDPGPRNGRGTYGRFRYVPSKGGLIVVNRTTESVFFYKLTNAISSAPSPTVTHTRTVTPTVSSAATLPRRAPYRLNPTVSIAATSTSVTSGSSATLTRSSANRITTTPTGAITTVQVVSSTASAQTNVPITFGHVFKQGDVPTGYTVIAKDSLGNPVPLQVDKKATHADGSLRHAIISVVRPSLASGQTETIALTKATGALAPATVSPTTLTAAGFTASVNITLGGVVYTASADSLLNVLKTSTCTACKWLSGPIVNEWLVSAPLKTAAGIAHPHLAARFAIRSYTGQNKARVDVTIENDWAYEPNPQNFTYDANIIVGGNTVYSVNALKHYHHARWRKVFWWGAAPQVDVKFNTAYLIATKAVPNYDQSITISPTALSALDTNWTTAGSQHNFLGQYNESPQTYDSNTRTGPMGQGITERYMPSTGGRPEIGPLPQWSAIYLLSMDNRAKNVMLGTGDLAGSWPVHYRDKNTDFPISIITYPYAQVWPGAGSSAGTGPGPKGVVKDWTFPAVVSGSGDGETAGPFTPDSAHQPSLAYLPYLVTGDYYYLEELQFWANWTMLRINYGGRSSGPVGVGLQGLMKGEQIRGQAWAMRTFGQAAYITPDTHPMKSYWMGRVHDNLADYHTKFVVGNPNQLGILYYTASYFFNSTAPYDTAKGASTGYASWQDDFFTWSMGYLTELGFTEAVPILAWKAKYPVGRMTAPGFYSANAAAYSLAVHDTSSSPIYTTFAQVWTATFGTMVDTSLPVKITVGTEAYGANMQPALAVAAMSGIPDADLAWTKFKAAAIGDYSVEPQFAIVPRN